MLTLAIWQGYLDILHDQSGDLAGVLAPFPHRISTFYTVLLAIWQVLLAFLHSVSGDSASALGRFTCSVWRFDRGI